MKKGKKNPKLSYSIRIIAGIYVAYLAITAIRSAITEGTSMNLTALIAIGVVLTVGGVVIAITGFMGYNYVNKHPEEFEEQDEDDESAEEETKEEENTAEEENKEAEMPVSKASGLMQRASLPEHLRVDADDEDSE